MEKEGKFDFEHLIQYIKNPPQGSLAASYAGEAGRLEDALSKLDERHRTLIEFEIECFDKTGAVPTNSEIHTRFKDRYDDFTEEDAERLKAASHIAFVEAICA